MLLSSSADGDVPIAECSERMESSGSTSHLKEPCGGCFVVPYALKVVAYISQLCRHKPDAFA